MKCFCFIRYYWDGTEDTFFKMEGLDKKVSIGELHAAHEGLKEEESKLRANLFGTNEIIVPMEKILVLQGVSVKVTFSPSTSQGLNLIKYW